MSYRGLQWTWAALVLAPFLVAFDPHVGTKELVAFATALYVAGWVLLLAGRRRDLGGDKLAALFRARAVKVAAVAGLAGLQLVAVLVSAGTALLALLVTGAVLLGLWTVSRSAESLVQRVGNVLALGVTLAVCLLVGELVFRLPPVVARTGGGTPGLNRWAEANYDNLWEANPLRLRSFHLDEPKRPGTFRIVTLGDSFTWGYVVGDTREIWPYVLERNLRDRGLDAEVINLGRPALSTLDERWLLDQMGWLFEPDLVILQYTLNDPVPVSYADYFRLYPLVPGLNHYLDNTSYLFSFLNGRFRSLQMSLFYPEREAALFADEFEGWQASRDALLEMASESDRRGIAFFAVLFPLFEPAGLDEATYPFLEAHRKVEKTCRAAGIPFLDLRPTFAAENRPGRSWWALPSDSHPGPEGHRLAGRAIAEAVMSSGLAPQAGSGTTPSSGPDPPRR